MTVSDNGVDQSDQKISERITVSDFLGSASGSIEMTYNDNEVEKDYATVQHDKPKSDLRTFLLDIWKSNIFTHISNQDIRRNYFVFFTKSLGPPDFQIENAICEGNTLKLNLAEFDKRLIAVRSQRLIVV